MLFADVKLSAVISDRMMLQQDMPVRMWQPLGTRTG